MPSLFLIATICLLIGCLYPVYIHITTMEKTIQEVQTKQRNAEMKITTLENDNTELRGKLNSLAEFTQNKVKLLDTTVERLDGMNLFVKEFDKNYTVTYTLTDKLNTSIQFLHNFTDKIDKALVKIKDELDMRTTSINERFEKMEGCQSGYEVGALRLFNSDQAFPLDRTVKFDPPFQKVPAFSYGTTLLASGSQLSVNLELISLTTESFTIKFHNMGLKNALFGAGVSWMACPK